MSKIQSKTINIEGLDVHYYVAGQGDPLVVIHGGGGDARTWWDNITELSKQYTVYAPDLPGYGGSQPLDGNYFIPELSEFIDRFAASLGLEQFNLVGHSLGGGIALNYTLKSPHRIKKLVLVSSLCLGNEIALWVRLLSIPALLRSVGALSMAVLKGLKWLVMRMLNPAQIIMPLSPASVSIGGSVTNFRQQSLVLENRLSEVRVPTLLVWGEKDPIVPVRHAYTAARTIPDCQVKVFEKSGHNVHRDELRQFSDTLNGFLG